MLRTQQDGGYPYWIGTNIIRRDGEAHMRETNINSTILALDVEGFAHAHRTVVHQVAIRHGFYNILKSAFHSVGIPWESCYREDRGDGALIIVPSEVPKSVLIEQLPSTLSRELSKHNKSHSPGEQIRLRMSVHAGEIIHDEHGLTGPALILPFRLLDSRHLRETLATATGNLALIASSSFYDEVIAHIPTSENYRRVRVSVKDTDSEAWICLPDLPSGQAVDPHGPDSPGLPALIVHSMPELSFAAELSGALRGLTTEGLVTSVGLRAVGRLDEETEELVDARTRREPGVVLLLVSRDLMATGYGGTTELAHLRRRHQIIVRSVIVKPTSWEDHAFGGFAALPADGVPVSQWASRDDAIKNIVDGVRLAIREVLFPRTETAVVRPRQPAQELGDVFKPAGIPTTTFVEPEDFIEFRMALRHPSLGVVLEGPSGIGKTTLLRHAVSQDADRLGEVPILSARRPADIPKIRRLLDGHEGLVAVDDFHRLPADLQHQLGDYLKLLADDDGMPGKLTIVGIPGTAKSLVKLAPDVATRIRVFKPGRAAETLLLKMIEQGESALNITFDTKTEIAMASAGSLLTAQMLCWHLAVMNNVERTADENVAIHTDIARARKKVTKTLDYKYRQVVNDFIVMDNPTEPLCIDLLLALAARPDGILRLDPVANEKPELHTTINRVFVMGLPDYIAEHLYYDPRGHRLIADDPQFVFYLRQLSRAQLLDIAGKRLPLPRDQIFVCYSHKDADWLDRVEASLHPLVRKGLIDLWSDRRIEAGDMWRKEIAAALARARVALLLISADFFASDFIHSEELPPLLEAAEQGGCRVIPLLLRPSIFSKLPELSRFNSVPSGTTLSELPKERGERVLADLTMSLFQ